MKGKTMESLFKGKSLDAAGSTARETPMVRAGGSRALERHLARQDIRLGPIARLVLSQESGRVLRERLTEMSAALIEKQKQELSQRLMLDLDLSKKRAFASYQARVGELNAELIAKSNEMERDLTEMLFVEIERIYGDKRRWEKRLRELELTRDELEQELDRLSNKLGFAIDQVEGKVNLMIQAQSRSLQVTLELLRDKAISGEDAVT